VKKILPLFVLFFGLFSTSIAQKSSPTSPQRVSSARKASPTCPLTVSIQDNTPAAVCSELLKTLVAVTSPCTDTTAVSYRWSSTVGGVFSTSRTTTFNLPEFLVTTPVTFIVLVVEGTDSLLANYTVTVKPRPSRPNLTPFGTIVLCDNNPVTLTSSACAGGSLTIWSNGASGVSSINVPAIGGTYYSVACYKNGCISDSTAAAALITGLVTSPPTTISKTICEGTTITTGNGLQADLVNCSNGASGTYTYTGGTVGYDAGSRNNGGVDPSVNIPTLSSIIKKVSISITWRKQKGGYQNDCGVGDTQTWPYHNETQFRVKSPSGKIVTLVNTNTYGGANNPTITTVFEDGGTPINFYSPPVSGTFAPAQPLSGFIGENPSGTWTLLPYDAVGKDPLCVSGFSVTFSEAQNGTLTWWDAPTGGNQVGTGSEFIPTNTVAGTYNYYAQGQCVRGCPSVRTAATLTIQPTPPAPVISMNVPDVNGTKSICYGESITLTATGCTGTVKWSSNQNGTNFATGATYSFTPSGGNYSNTTHSFTAICEGSNLCKSVNSNTLSVVVKYKPVQPTISGPGSSICSNTSITLTSSSTYGGTFGWTGNRTGNPINFILTNAVNIKVANTVNGCTSDSSNVYAITTLPRPNTVTVNASQVQALCYGSPVTLTASACSGTIKWTGNLTGSPLTVTPLTSRSYKAACLGTNGCASDSSAALTIVVLPKTKPIITGSTFICGTGASIPVTLTATGCSAFNETVMWRSEDTGLTYTETISQTKTFRAVCIRNGYCVSDSSDIFTVQYRNKPSQPSITPPQNTTICQGTSVSLTASACVGGTLG
jgi:Ig-like domain CHU_C associated